MGRQWITSYLIARGLISCGALHLLGSFGVFPEKVIKLLFGWRNWMGKHSLNILESGFLVFDVDYLEGA